MFIEVLDCLRFRKRVIKSQFLCCQSEFFSLSSGRRNVFCQFQEFRYHGIADTLTKDVIPTSGGKKKWSISTVKSILSNEKYKGDVLLQKSYTVDFLTKKTKVNEGEIPQYYVENNHETIIDPEVFEMV